jgi:hypothetical protein
MTIVVPLALGLLLTVSLGGCDVNALLPGLNGAGTLDTAYFKSKMPPLKQGQKWTYQQSTQVTGLPAVSSDFTREIMKVEGDVATVKTTVAGVSNTATASARTLLTSGTPMANMSLPTGLDFGVATDAAMVDGGTEDVTVPFKTFKGAAKIKAQADSAAALSSSTVWLSPEVGMVKMALTTNAAGMQSSLLVELKDFVTP